MKQLDVDVSPPASPIILNQSNWQMASVCLQIYNTVLYSSREINFFLVKLNFI